MRFSAVVTSATLLAGLLGACQSGPGQRPPHAPELLIGQAAPPLDVEVLIDAGELNQAQRSDGSSAPDRGLRTHTISWEGRVTLVDFWATWCTPCVESLPKLAAKREALEGAGVQVVVVNMDDADDARVETVSAWLAEHAPDLSTYMDDGTSQGRWAIRSLPMAFVVDCSGVVRWFGAGARATEDAMELSLELADSC